VHRDVSAGETAISSRTMLFAGCDALAQGGGLARAALAVARELGAPLGLAPETALCCGLKLVEAGHPDDFTAHATAVRASLGPGPVNLVFLTPGCARAVREKWPPLPAGSRVEHITTYLARALATGGIAAERPPLPISVVWHDPCELSRGLAEVTAPRALLAAAVEEVREPIRTGVDTSCCGAAGLLPRSLPEVAASMAALRRAELDACAAQLTRGALRNGCDLVVAVGGDGTINEVVNGFFETPLPGEPPRPVRKGAALGILPRGTGGDLRRTLGLDPDLRKCGPRLAGARKPIDVGRVDFVRDDGNPGARYFINVGEAGVGSEVVTLANRGSKALGGKLTFTIASLRALASWEDVAIRWSLDGGVFEEDEVTTFAVANGRYFGGGMQVAPGALIDDGLFGITIWRGYGLADFVLRSGSR